MTDPTPAAAQVSASIGGGPDRALAAARPGPPTGLADTRGFDALHADAVRVLGSWGAPDGPQEALRMSYLDHLAAHRDGVRRDGPPVHLTASTIVVDADHTHLLLVLHRKAGRWFQPGGHLEATDASLAAAARREAQEETGVGDLSVSALPVQLDRHALSGAFGRCREHLDVRYLAVAGPHARLTVSSESLDVRWWPLDALPSSAPTGIERLLATAPPAPPAPPAAEAPPR